MNALVESTSRMDSIVNIHGMFLCLTAAFGQSHGVCKWLSRALVTWVRNNIVLFGVDVHTNTISAGPGTEARGSKQRR